MLNSIVIVGRKKSNCFQEKVDDIHFARMVIQVKRPYYNSDGSCCYDEIIVKVFKGTSDLIDEKFPIGALLVIKGRIEEHKDHLAIVVAETVEYIYEKNPSIDSL